MSSTVMEFEIPSHLEGLRLDAILAELLPERTRAAWQKAVRRGHVCLNGQRVLRSNVVPGRAARLKILAPDASNVPPPTTFGVLYEDEHILVVDKPGGLLTHSNEKEHGQSLADLVAARFGRLPMLLGEERPGIVHRLDRQTSGVLVLARNAQAMQRLQQAFRNRRIRKHYLALVHGRPRDPVLELDWDLGPRVNHPDRQECRVRGRGKEAQTRVEQLEQLGEFSLLRCSPRTGRRHQIRVHLAAADLPIIADEIYRVRGVSSLPPEAPKLRCHALHAEVLILHHPQTGEELEFRADPPAAFQKLLGALRAQASA